ncbi:MAG: cell division topological specificity factor MinE [Chloroflexi bacterium]|nr:cell division topological specificity factor MinE [Chloroflexota bacterium]
MSGFLDRLLGRGKGSGATAKQRLQFILVHDRINLSPERMEEMKREILAVISKYVNVDDDHVDIALQQGNQRGSVLVAEVPFTKAVEGIERDDPEILSSLDETVPKRDAASGASRPEADEQRDD